MSVYVQRLASASLLNYRRFQNYITPVLFYIAVIVFDYCTVRAGNGGLISWHCAVSNNINASLLSQWGAMLLCSSIWLQSEANFECRWYCGHCVWFKYMCFGFFFLYLYRFIGTFFMEMCDIAALIHVLHWISVTFSCSLHHLQSILYWSS